MNMLESRPGRDALVLVNKDVAKSSVGSKFQDSMTIGSKDCFKLGFS